MPVSVANSSDDKYSHLTEEDRGKVRKVCDDAMQWLDTQNAGQEKLPLTSDPVLTSFMIYDELRKVQAVSNPVVNKKKPPPPKPAATEGKEKTEGDKEETKPKSDKKEDEMDVDAEKEKGQEEETAEDKEKEKEGVEMETDLD